ncbi:MAG: histone deacetylase [Candidatus Omnitrophica bacterium]|nr:histone deacetylase [Candidatus Omnitrophota bacterium]
MGRIEIKAIYSDAYEVDIGLHIFPTVKFRLIREKLIKDKLLKEEDFIQAPPASTEQILLAHTESYLNKLDQGTLSPQELFTLELPYSKALVRASRICVGGTILAAKLALEQKRPCLHLGGGFHHAFSDHGEGFCVLNDVACAVKFCSLRKGVDRIMIVDCDLHQGNGNADIFRDYENVFTFSIHEQNNYPPIKPPSDLDIGLPSGTEDEQYLDALRNNLPKIFQDFQPQLIFYIAGADPYLKDQLGGLGLTMDGLSRRDEFIFTQAKRKGATVVVVLGGGYCPDIKDTVNIHYNTAKKALEVFG